MADLGPVAIRNLTTDKRVIRFYDVEVPYTCDSHDALSRCILDCAYAVSLGDNPARWTTPETKTLAVERDPTYIGNQRQVRGTVVNSDDEPIEKWVMAVNANGIRVSPIVRSEADGTFSFLVGNSGTMPLLIVALPDPGDNRNAAVKWRITPVVP